MRILHDAKATTRALILTVGGMWLAAGVLAWLLPPRLVVQPTIAQDAAEISRALGAFALFTGVVGALELVGLVVVWRAPRLAIGRLLLLFAGVMMIVAGLFLLNGGALQSPEVQWSVGPAIIGLAVVAVFIAAGVLASAAALFSSLPGASIAERMTVRGEIAMGRPRRELLLLLTGALVVCWIWTMSTVLRTHSAEPFDVMQFLMPLLAGALAGVWRAGKPSRLPTLGLAAVAGAASSWLFLLAMILGQYYRFDPVAYVFWWGLTGGVFGALGYSGWLLGRRLLRRRHSHASPAHAH